MKVVGLIVEYNPFHNGHLYHLNKAKELTNADVVIAVMSGNFVQRGEPAIVSKKHRVYEALKQGVDIVVELPFLYTVQNANIFAKFALEILNNLKVNGICFGSETGDTKDFLKKYENSSLITPHLDFLVSDLMKEGYAYPKAMSLALEEIDEFRLETPNDILGLAYYSEIKEKKYPIEIHTIKRTNDYKEEKLTTNFSSASAVRKAVISKENIESETTMAKVLNELQPVTLDDFFPLLQYKLVTSSANELDNIHLVNEGIQYLFKKNITKAKSMDEFIKMCTSKRYTAARIKRTIVHMLTNTNKQFSQKFLNKQLSYIRLLGFNKTGANYLKSIRKDLQVPVLSKFKKSFKLLNEEKKITYLYASKLNKETQQKLYEEEHYLFPIKYELN